jgi:hypothetical protein
MSHNDKLIDADKADRGHPIDGGRVTFMAEARNWVMARRPGNVPFVMTVQQWKALELYSASTVSTPLTRTPRVMQLEGMSPGAPRTPARRASKSPGER